MLRDDFYKPPLIGSASATPQQFAIAATRTDQTWKPKAKVPIATLHHLVAGIPDNLLSRKQESHTNQ
jgi:hypothetical protein